MNVIKKPRNDFIHYLFWALTGYSVEKLKDIPYAELMQEALGRISIYQRKIINRIYWFIFMEVVGEVVIKVLSSDMVALQRRNCSCQY